MILVTGCNSYIGRKLVQKLIDDGHKVRCLDTEKPKDFDLNVNFIEGDVLDELILQNACTGVETIFHLMDIENTSHHKRKYMKKTNIKGTENLLFAAQRANVQKIFFKSSYEVYGKVKKIPGRQDDKKRPITKYGKDKLKAENICWNYDKKGKLAITILRPSLIAGPGIDDPILLITLYMALGMDEANRIYICGSGETRFQLLHPDDAIDGFIKAFNFADAKSKVYNLGSDTVPTQIEQWIKVKDEAKLDCTFINLSRFKTKLLSVILKPFKINYLTKEHLQMLLRNIMLDCQRAKEDLDWAPEKNNIEIILETIEWYKNEKL